ncbi:MAG: hypothetical protein WC909_03290 [Candidatus Paceibacterota bacterium]|jgi:hypothetical protein
MMEENIIRLTNALYRATSFFPKEEPLKFAIRKEGLDVLFFINISRGKSVPSSNQEKEEATKKVLSKIELIKTYFSIAKEQDWISSENYSILERNYDSLKDFVSSRVVVKEVKKIVEKAKPVEVKKTKDINYEELSSVQLKVLEILQNKGQLKSVEISESFPNMNPRTIRRELKGLKDLKIVVSAGGGKTTIYEINKSY